MQEMYVKERRSCFDFYSLFFPTTIHFTFFFLSSKRYTLFQVHDAPINWTTNVELVFSIVACVNLKFQQVNGVVIPMDISILARSNAEEMESATRMHRSLIRRSKRVLLKSMLQTATSLSIDIKWRRKLDRKSCLGRSMPVTILYCRIILNISIICT